VLAAFPQAGNENHHTPYNPLKNKILPEGLGFIRDVIQKLLNHGFDGTKRILTN